MQKRLDRVTEVGLAVPEPGGVFTETSSAATYSRASSIVEEALPEGSSPTHKTHLATRYGIVCLVTRSSSAIQYSLFTSAPLKLAVGLRRY